MKRTLFLRNKYVVVLSFFVLVLSMTMLGCSGSTGSTGATGPAGPAGASAAATTGTVSGTVDSAAGTALSGIQVMAYLSTSPAGTAGTAAAQISPSQNYQRAKNHATTATPVAQALTNSSGQYTLSLQPGTYDIVFNDPTGTYTIGAMSNYSVVAGTSYTINAGMGAASTTNVAVSTSSSAGGAPTVTVSPSATAEVGYGGTVTLTAQATSPLSKATFSYAWTAKYSANPGTATTPALTSMSGTSTTVTLPTLAQAFGGITSSAYNATTAQAYPFNSGTYVPPSGNPYSDSTKLFGMEPRIGVLPITADTRGTVSTTVTVTDGQGGSSSTSVSSYAAGIQTGAKNVAVGLPVYLNSGHTGTSAWTFTSIPSGSKATLQNATTQNAWFVPDVAGAYVVKESSTTANSSPSTNPMTIYAGTWYGVITGGGETSQTVNASGFTKVTSGGNVVSNLYASMWFTTANTTFWPNGATGSATYTNWPTITVNPICLDCHATGSTLTITGLASGAGAGVTVAALDDFTPWTYTVHATIFARNLNAISNSSAGGSCLVCHSVGYDTSPGATQSGFSGIAALDGWSAPAEGYTKVYDNWKSMVSNTSYSNLAQLSNIQCENCHGPQQSSSHESGLVGNNNTGVAGGTRVSYGSEVCGSCHGEGSGSHNRYSEWIQSINPGTPGDTVTILATPLTPSYSINGVVAGSTGHGHSHWQQLTITGVPSSDDLPPTAVSCSRCHTAEGFTAYTKQLVQYTGQSQIPSTAGILQNTYVPNSVTSSGSVVWTPDNVHPQTCAACHDPHSDSNPNQLRIYDSVPMTMAGFGVSGLGKGAICTACHNSRNGMQCDSAHQPVNGIIPSYCSGGATTPGPSGPTFNHEDTDPVAPLYLDTPHDNTQAEVLMGREAFFMGSTLPMLSPHAAIQDSCVGCHMTLNPQTHSSSNTVSDHVFYITDAERPTLCANCHSSGGNVNGLAIISSTLNAMAQLNAAMGPALKAQLLANTTIYVGSSHKALNSSQITMVSFGNIINSPTSVSSAQSSFYFYTAALNATTGLPSGNYAVSGGLSAITTDSAGTIPLFGANSKFKKAVWNIQLIGKDYSNGIHNPNFVSAVLSNTLAAVSNSAVY